MTDEPDLPDEHTVRVRRPAALPSWAIPAPDVPGSLDDATLRIPRSRPAPAPAPVLSARSPDVREITPSTRSQRVVSRTPAELAATEGTEPGTARPTPNAPPGGERGRVASGEQAVVDGAAIERDSRRAARIRMLAVAGIAVAVVVASAVLLVVLVNIS